MTLRLPILCFCGLLVWSLYGQGISYQSKQPDQQVSFVKIDELIKFTADQDELYVYRFDHTFLRPPPPFIETSTSQKRQVHSDSLFTVKTDEYVKFSKARLYFIQKDTTSLKGLAFRVVQPSFPKFETVAEVIEPLLYVMTTREQERFATSQNKKKTLDDFLRQISQNNLRKAQSFMQNYFKRVRKANTSYTNFKPGWKTDKGMIYIIFGDPKTIRTKGNEEIWSYEGNLDFHFLKKETIFSDQHYILDRHTKYRYPWQTQQGKLRANQF